MKWRFKVRGLATGMRWRFRARRLALVAGSVLILTGLGLTAGGLVQQAKVQQAVAARGANDVNAVNSWLAGSVSPGQSSGDAATPASASPSAGTCGGGGSESDAYALVEFTGLPQYGYVGVAVSGDWTQLDDRSMVHWYGSPAPGGDGNVIIAFHREPDYQNIDQLGVGETITIEDRSCQTYVYTVTQRWVLDPSAVTQLVPTGGQQLTLITCTPWWQDYDRIVWRADLTSVDGVPVSS
jgi:LPXTG-site transpeptidase (sortase) family protein